MGENPQPWRRRDGARSAALVLILLAAGVCGYFVWARLSIARIERLPATVSVEKKQQLSRQAGEWTSSLVDSFADVTACSLAIVDDKPALAYCCDGGLLRLAFASRPYPHGSTRTAYTAHPTPSGDWSYLDFKSLPVVATDAAAADKLRAQPADIASLQTVKGQPALLAAWESNQAGYFSCDAASTVPDGLWRCRGIALGGELPPKSAWIWNLRLVDCGGTATAILPRKLTPDSSWLRFYQCATPPAGDWQGLELKQASLNVSEALACIAGCPAISYYSSDLQCVRYLRAAVAVPRTVDDWQVATLAEQEPPALTRLAELDGRPLVAWCALKDGRLTLAQATRPDPQSPADWQRAPVTTVRYPRAGYYTTYFSPALNGLPRFELAVADGRPVVCFAELAAPPAADDELSPEQSEAAADAAELRLKLLWATRADPRGPQDWQEQTLWHDRAVTLTCFCLAVQAGRPLVAYCTMDGSVRLARQRQ